MSHVLIVNPAERPSKARKATSKGKPKMAKKQRSRAQIAATKKMIAANKARRAGKPVSRAKPAKRRAKSSYAIAEVPARKSPARRRKGPFTSAAEASVAGRKLRYRRRNPIGGGFIGETLVPSAIGGGGALALDVIMGVLPLPAQMKTGPLAPVVKVAGAIGLGMLAKTVTSRKTAEQIAAGAITVTLYQVARGMLAKISGGRIPGLAAYPDSDIVYDPMTGAVIGMGEYVGQYVNGDDGDGDGVGYPSAGQIVGNLQPDGSVSGWETGVYR